MPPTQSAPYTGPHSSPPDNQFVLSLRGPLGRAAMYDAIVNLRSVARKDTESCAHCTKAYMVWYRRAYYPWCTVKDTYTAARDRCNAFERDPTMSLYLHTRALAEGFL